MRTIEQLNDIVDRLTNSPKQQADPIDAARIDYLSTIIVDLDHDIRVNIIERETPERAAALAYAGYENKLNEELDKFRMINRTIEQYADQAVRYLDDETIIKAQDSGLSAYVGFGGNMISAKIQSIELALGL